MIAIIDYDAGNLKSVEKALIALGEEVMVSRDSSEILQADKVILPGVGSFLTIFDNLGCCLFFQSRYKIIFSHVRSSPSCHRYDKKAATYTT